LKRNAQEKGAERGHGVRGKNQTKKTGTRKRGNHDLSKNFSHERRETSSNPPRRKGRRAVLIGARARAEKRDGPQERKKK